MSPITHFLTGWALANVDSTLTRRERAFVTWAAVIPDLDGLGIIAEIATRNSARPLKWWIAYHHVLGHNIGFAVLVTVLAAMFSANKLKVAALVFVSFHSHLIGDLAGARGPDGHQWPIPYLLPFSNGLQLSWSGQWALNAWQNIVFTAGLMLAAVVLAVRRGYSPVEIFSKRVDGIVVAALRERLGKPEGVRVNGDLG